MMAATAARSSCSCARRPRAVSGTVAPGAAAAAGSAASEVPALPGRLAPREKRKPPLGRGMWLSLQ